MHRVVFVVCLMQEFIKDNTEEPRISTALSLVLSVRHYVLEVEPFHIFLP